MQLTKRIILVGSSFEAGKGLLKWLAKYSQSSDDAYAYYDEFAFTPYPKPQCDGVLILNTISETIKTDCPAENIIAIMMEPGIRELHPWMFKDLEQYSQVHSPIPMSNNTVISHGYLGWYFNHDLQTLKDLRIPQKTKVVSCIASGLKQLEGHRLRLSFIEMLKKEFNNIDFFGKDGNYLQEKMDGLLPYRYSIAIENATIPFYFTEKINDCFLSWTVPIYHGCMNIGKFFPEKSFIKIDIRDTERSLRTIRNILENDDWNLRTSALQEARQLVLENYQPLAGASKIFRSIGASGIKNSVVKPVRYSFIQKTGNILQKFLKSKS